MMVNLRQPSTLLKALVEKRDQKKKYFELQVRYNFYCIIRLRNKRISSVVLAADSLLVFQIIHRTIKSPEATEIASEYTGDANGKGNARNSPRDSKAKNSALLQKPGINNAATVPAVTVD